MKVVVTGAGGLIGSHLCRLLLKERFDVRAVVRPGGHRENLRDLAQAGVLEIVEADICDDHGIRKALAGCQVCYHTAALVSPTEKDQKKYLAVNTQGTMAVCRAALAAGIDRFIFTSSCVVYGSAGRGEIINETRQRKLGDILGDYGRSKFLAQTEIQAAIREGLPAVIVNPTAVIGPQDVNLTPAGAFIVSYLKGRVPAYFRTGFNIVDARDVARGHLQAFRHGRVGSCYLLGNTNVMLEDLFKELNAVSGVRRRPLRVPYSVAHAGSWLIYHAARLIGESALAKRAPESVRKVKYPYFFDSGKAAQELEWRPEIPLRQSLQETIEWYQKAGYV